MFFVYRGLQGAPTGAGRRSQAAFRANLHEPKSKSHPKPGFLSGCATFIYIYIFLKLVMLVILNLIPNWGVR